MTDEQVASGYVIITDVWRSIMDYIISCYHGVTIQVIVGQYIDQWCVRVRACVCVSVRVCACVRA